jgi:hypothetical protein
LQGHPALQYRRQSDNSTGFGDDMEMVIREAHGIAHFGIRGRDAAGQRVPVDFECHFAGDRGHDGVANGLAALGIGHALPGSQ